MASGEGCTVASRNQLTEDEVNALFSGKAVASFTPRERCDNCAITYDAVLEFGGDLGLEMPVDEGGDLARELSILRDRLHRRRIVLCYSCVDALQTPPGGPRRVVTLRSTRQPNPAGVKTSRLFES